MTQVLRLVTFVAVGLGASWSLAQGIQDADEVGNWPAPLLWKGAVARQAGEARPQSLETASGPLPLIAISPCRMLDTRVTGGPIASGSSRDATLTGAPCGIPSTAVAVSGNFALFNIVGAGGNGVLKVWPSGSPSTFQALLNWSPTAGQIDNASIVTLGTGGAITVQPNQGGGTIDLVIDVNGYYDGSGLITGVTAGTGLAGGGTSGTVSVGIAAGGVTSTELAANAVTSAKIAANAVTAGAIAPGQVVKSVNGATDGVTVAGSGAVTVSTAGSTITVGGGAPSGSFVLGNPGDTTLIGAGYTEFGPSGQDAWKATATILAPPGAQSPSAIWTGTRMIVWGGFGPSSYTNTGGQYDPVTDSWTATTTVGAPVARTDHTAVWTGTKMVVWGGTGSGGPFNSGGRYDPLTNSWAATSVSGAVPTGRRYHTAIWTGSKMIVWGGFSVGGFENTGGQYDPSGDSWTATTTSSAPLARDYQTAVWTGSKMIVWGGNRVSFYNTGGLYDPAGDSWTPTSITGAPEGRFAHRAIWTGLKMIVFGGVNSSSAYLNTGGLYDPAGDTWTATSTIGAPSPRAYMPVLWTGSKMILWGGYDGVNPDGLNTGGQYDPAADGWTATTLAGAPSRRASHVGVWTGSNLIVWGGNDSLGVLQSGGLLLTLSLYKKN